MSCNPCCCWKLKDAAVTVGIWSTMFCIIQLAIFGWQTAAIKYEKDRAANTLLPNYNTYGRYDIPTYYESYWQSPEERYYTGLFVIQILCLIASFFLLFASIMLIYGIHTWSRYLVWPWFICMSSSILTSLAYCIMWWVGDVRDYWLVLTIIEAFAVFFNCYCFVVICVFYKRMLIELKYYEEKRAQKYNRFNHSKAYQLSPYKEFNDNNFKIEYPVNEQQNFWNAKNLNNSHFSYGQQQQLNNLQNTHILPEFSKSQITPQIPEKNPVSPIRSPFPKVNQSRLGISTTHSIPSLYDNFCNVSCNKHKKSKNSCRQNYLHNRQNKHKQHRSSNHKRSCAKCYHHHKRRHSHCQNKKNSSCYSLDNCSTTEHITNVSNNALLKCYNNKNLVKERCDNLNQFFDDNESRNTSDSTIEQFVCKTSKKNNNFEESKIDKKKKKTDEKNNCQIETKNLEQKKNNIENYEYNMFDGGITIPHHIVIPPNTLISDGFNEQKYQINSEITISYDPKKQKLISDLSNKDEEKNVLISSHSSTSKQTQPISIISNV